MYQPMLFLHWKQIRVALIPLMIGAFALPIVSVQGLGTPADGAEATAMAYQALIGIQGWLPTFPILAAVIGLTLGLSAWNWDHQLNHVHALSLPVPRWRYASLKMGAGAMLAVLPALSFWAGAHAAVASLTLPAGLHTYPDALALRFFLAMLGTYAASFALAAGTVRTTAILATGAFLFLLLGGSLGGWLGHYLPAFQDVNLVETTLKALMSTNGPLEIFSGSWMLIDV